MFNVDAWLTGLAATLIFAAAGWLFSLWKRDVSIVDSMWSIMFLICALSYVASVGAESPRAMLVLILVALWAVRLAAYITWRNWGEEEDHRYQKIRRNNSPNFGFKSIYIVFGLQAVLAWVISLPLLAAVTGTAAPGWLDLLGVLLWSTGLFFESVGDFQLARFRSKQDNAGQVLDRGLWRYTRHPNYFGDFCIWWGFYLIAVAAGGWWTIVAPLLMSFLLLKVSGVAMLERDIGNRRAEYADYIRETNAFFPGPHRSTN